MSTLKLSHAFVIPFAGMLVVTGVLAALSVSTEFLLFHLVLSLLNIGLPVTWLFRHRKEITTVGDVPRVLRSTLNMTTVCLVVGVALLLPPVAMLARALFALSDSTCSKGMMLTFVAALYGMFLWPGGEQTTRQKGGTGKSSATSE
jgi:hypothetical protein